MRRCATVALWLVCTRLALGQSPWRTGLDQALAESRTDGRMLMIDFRADWCGPCKLMERQVFTPTFLANNANRVVPVRIDLELRPDIARRFHIETLPSIVFTDSWGGELVRHTGTLDVATMSQLMGALPSDMHPINHDAELLSRDHNNVEILIDMAERLRAASFFSSSTTYLLRALQHGPAHREEVLDGLAANSLSLRQADSAKRWLVRCLKEFPASGRAQGWAGELKAIKEGTLR